MRDGIELSERILTGIHSVCDAIHEGDQEELGMEMITPTAHLIPTAPTSTTRSMLIPFQASRPKQGFESGSDQPHSMIGADHCALRSPFIPFPIPSLCNMPADKISKKRQCVADGVFYAELDEVLAFPRSRSSS